MEAFIIIFGLFGIIFLFYVFKGYSQNIKEKSVDKALQNISLEITYDENPPIDLEEKDPDKDAWEGGFWDASNPLPVKANLKFDYTDSNGNKTNRTVNVREFDEELYTGIMIGHCHLRDATRTFRFDRISNCIDIETGEAIEDVHTFLQAKYDTSPDRTLDKLLTFHYDVLRILLFLGKADGRLTEKERVAILEYTKTITKDDRLNDNMIKQIFAKIDQPSIGAFKQCCGRIAKELPMEEQQRLIVLAKKMVASEKTVNPTEQEALNYICKRLEPASSTRTVEPNPS